ncbi:MAG TPA: S9 family peptidase [Gemmatimonadetes bacterium]|nr:S9 family peptidase [Gemmatimonadota bacterium]
MVRLNPRLALLTVCFLFVSYNPTPTRAQQGSAGKSTTTLEDVFEVKNIGGVAMSPSGNEVLYTLNTVDLKENDSDTNIWLVRRSEIGWGDPIQLTNHPGNDSNPQWHPTGKRFAFLATGRESDESQSKSSSSANTSNASTNMIMEMSLLGGEPSQLLQHETNISSFQWSPDGRYIGFRASDSESQDRKTRKQNGRDVNLEDEPGSYTHIWLSDSSEASVKKLTEGTNFTVTGFSWSPDSRQIVFSGTPSDQPYDSWRSDVYLLDVNASTKESIKLTTNPGPDSNPQWSPDGNHIFYMGQQTDNYQVAMNRVWKISAMGGLPEEVSPKGDIQPARYKFTADGTGAFFETTTGTTRGLFYIDLEIRKPIRISPDSGVRGSFSFSQNNEVGVYVFEDPTSPVELYLSSFEDGPNPNMSESMQLTNHNSHTKIFAVGKTETIQWENNVDGKEVEGVLLYPAGWTKKDGPRATVVKIHGGPSGVYVENFQAASSGADAQRYAGDGYFVLLPNPRGSSGYGEAGLQSVVQDWGGLDFQDIMSGVDHLIAEGYAHPDSLGVMGWSYGGFMTAWAVTQTDRFKAAVAGAAITENISMWGTQDIQHVFEAYFGGGPYEPGLWEVYQRSNPLAFVQNASTPTMIIHGENDPRVPPNQARTFYRGLRANGVETKLVWLPRTGHGPREPGLQFERSLAQKEWMDQHIRKVRPIT